VNGMVVASVRSATSVGAADVAIQGYDGDVPVSIADPAPVPASPVSA